MAVKTDWAAGDVLTASQVNTYLANSGLVFVTSVEITSSSVSTISVPNAFSEDFDDYLIKISGLDMASSADLLFQFEDSGGSAVTTNYSTVGSYQTWGSASNVGFFSSTWGMPLSATELSNIHIEIQNPYKSNYSYMQTQYCHYSRAYWINGMHATSSPYGRFRLTSSSNFNATDGHIDVYGYRHP
jgi:hypothetical protein